MNDMINTIIHGDCLDVMQRIDSESIDMILCDLPYGMTKCKWDSVIPIMALWNQYKRIIKRSGAIVLTASQPFTSRLVSTNYSMFRYEWVWQKHKGTNIFLAKKQPLKVHESILVFGHDSPSYYPQMTDGESYKQRGSHNVGKEGALLLDKKPVGYAKDHDPSKRYPVSVQKFSNHNEKRNSLHPTQKPVALFEYLIRTYTNENDLVLDNCIGSGTTAIAALNTNRRFIGIELDANYHQIAINRVNEWHRERELQTTQ